VRSVAWREQALNLNNGSRHTSAMEIIMSVRMRMIFAVALLAAAMGCGQSSPPMAPTPTPVSAMIVSGGLTPDPISDSVGSTVRWTNQDTPSHLVVSDNGAFNSGTIAAGGQYSYAFPTAGTFTYHDSSNPKMVGTVNVSGSSTSPSPY
jgi:plastocyanin